MTLKEKILAKLKMDDKGRIEKFLHSEIKKFNKFITQLKSNLAQIELTHTIELDALNDNIEDAASAVEEAYQNVDIERLKNNAEIANFSEEYWRNISNAESNVKLLNNKLLLIEEKYQKEVDIINEQILKYQNRIKKLS